MIPDEEIERCLDGIIDAILEMKVAAVGIGKCGINLDLLLDGACTSLYFKLKALDETWED